MKGERAISIFEINEDHCRGVAAPIHFRHEVVAGGAIRRAVGQQICQAWFAIFNSDRPDDSEGTAKVRAKLALQAFGAGGLGK